MKMDIAFMNGKLLRTSVASYPITHARVTWDGIKVTAMLRLEGPFGEHMIREDYKPRMRQKLTQMAGNLMSSLGLASGSMPPPAYHEDCASVEADYGNRPGFVMHWYLKETK